MTGYRNTPPHPPGPAAEGDAMSTNRHGQCEVPPEGWYCTREPGHDGPCAAAPTEGAARDIAREALEKIRLFNSPWWVEKWGSPAELAGDVLREMDRA